MNKGFKSLPEYVQRKIDPEMAKRYMGGGAVMDRPLFRQAGGPAQPNMQEMAAMGQQYLMQPEAPMGMPQQQVDPQQAAMVQQQEQHYAEDGAKIGETYATEMMDMIDQADDPKSMIDAFRGNAKPLEDRYAELAGYVGEEDANKTPESVLAMVQPTIMMTEEGAIDSGIGELMQQLVAGVDMSEGEAMGQGVGELMAMGAGNTPPANFNQGGAVRRFAPGGAVASGAAAYMPEFQKLYSSVLGDQSARQAELDEQKRLTQAQMLFDIAQTGLQFAGQTEGRSIAERLANAASATQLFPRIGERAAGQMAAKQAVEKEKRQMDLAALQSSIQASQSDVSAQQAYDRAVATKSATSTKADIKRVVGADGEIVGTFNLSTTQGLADFNKAIEEDPKATAYNIGTEPTKDGFKTIQLFDPNNPSALPTELPINTAAERKIVGQKLAEGFTSNDTFFAAAIADEYAQKREVRGEEVAIRAETRGENIAIRAENRALDTTLSAESRALSTQIAAESRALERAIAAESRANDRTLSAEDREEARTQAAEARAEQSRIREELRNNGYDVEAEKRKIEYDIAAESRAAGREQTVYERNRADELSDVAAAIEADIQAEERRLDRTLNAEERANVEFNRRFAMETDSQIAREERALGRTLNEEERANAEFRARQAVETQQRIQLETSLLDMRGNYEFRDQNGQIVAIDKKTREVTPIFGTPDAPEPEYVEVTLPNADNVPTKSIVDITSPQGKAALAKVNEITASGGQASMQKISTASVTPRGFLIPEKGVYTSYDGGRTYVDENGVTQSVPGDAFEVSNTIAYDVSKNEKVRANALAQLAEMDRAIISGMTDAEGNPLTSDQMMEVKDAYEQARKGTGFWAKVSAGLDAAIGGVSGGYFSVGRGKQDARQYVRMLRVMGRSALAASPRFAVADLQTTEQLFPNEQSLIASPETEARKLISLSTELDAEKRRILTALSGDTPLDAAQSKLFKQKLFEIDRLQSMIGPVTDRFNPSTQEAKDEAAAAMQRNVKRRKQGPN